METQAREADRPGTRNDSADAERFVDAFRDAWADPDVDGLSRLLHPDVRLFQPVAPPARGLEAARETLGAVLDAMPGVRGEVHRWAAAGDCVLIEFSLISTMGKRPFRLRLVDRFLLSGGLALERVTYFDPLPLLGAVLAHPSAWSRWWRAVLWPRLRPSASRRP